MNSFMMRKSNESTYNDYTGFTHRHSTRLLQEFISRWDDLHKRTLSIDSEADSRAALGVSGSELVEMNVEVGLVEEGVGKVALARPPPVMAMRSLWMGVWPAMAVLG